MRKAKNNKTKSNLFFKKYIKSQNLINHYTITFEFGSSYYRSAFCVQNVT